MIFQLEIKQWWKATLLWALILAGFLSMVIAMYPLMANDISGIVTMIQSLGIFSQALKLNDLMLDRLMGFYAMEMENMLGISGAVFAGYMGGKMLAKEEILKTSEFLLTHPIRRLRVFLEKLSALFSLILGFNITIAFLAWLIIHWTQQSVPLYDFLTMHAVMTLVHLLLGGLTFAVSAFWPQEGLGISLGMVFMMYILNILINIDDRLEVFKWVTPFQFAYASDVLNQGPNVKLMVVNIISMAIIIVFAAIYYAKKDIKS